MNTNEQFEMCSHAAAWVANEAETLIEEYKKSTPAKQKELLLKMKHMLGRLKFEGKEIGKYIEEDYGN